MSKPRPIVVTGMHRSGTSAVTKMLELFGYSLGSKEYAFAPDASNPKGYNENSVMLHISEEILKTLGLLWDRPAIIQDGFENYSQMERIWKENEERFNNEFPGDTRVVWKDPRVCLTYPFWRKFLGIDPIVIMCVRNPVDVAKSLWERDRMKSGLATCLWKTHTASIIAHTRNTAVVKVMYDDVVENPTREMRRVWAFTSIKEENKSIKCDDKAMLEYKNYIDGKLRHHKSDLSRLFDPTVDIGATALYCSLAELWHEDIANAILGKV